ncbi:hypothetical protein [Pseudomonas umsongensis]
MAAWQATPRQACSILRISPSTFRRAARDVGVGSMWINSSGSDW